MLKETPRRGNGWSRKWSSERKRSTSISKENIGLLKGPHLEGGAEQLWPTAGTWRLSLGQLRTYCLARKCPRRKAGLKVTCCDCVPWDLEWGEA